MPRERPLPLHPEGIERILIMTGCLVLALVKSVELVGEAANAVSPETRASFETVSWRDIVAMWNRLVHG